LSKTEGLEALQSRLHINLESQHLIDGYLLMFAGIMTTSRELNIASNNNRSLTSFYSACVHHRIIMLT
jgi:hypothetical protein